MKHNDTVTQRVLQLGTEDDVRWPYVLWRDELLQVAQSVVIFLEKVGIQQGDTFIVSSRKRKDFVRVTVRLNLDDPATGFDGAVWLCSSGMQSVRIDPIDGRSLWVGKVK